MGWGWGRTSPPPSSSVRASSNSLRTSSTKQQKQTFLPSAQLLPACGSAQSAHACIAMRAACFTGTPASPVPMEAMATVRISCVESAENTAAYVARVSSIWSRSRVRCEGMGPTACRIFQTPTCDGGGALRSAVALGMVGSGRLSRHGKLEPRVVGSGRLSRHGTLEHRPLALASTRGVDLLHPETGRQDDRAEGHAAREGLLAHGEHEVRIQPRARARVHRVLRAGQPRVDQAGVRGNTHTFRNFAALEGARAP